MTMLTSSNKPVQNLTNAEEERMKTERMRDVLILLEHLAEREEVTVKMILDGLYDIGAVNWVNNNCGVQSLQRPLKSVARMSKPAFRMLALRWFKKNCPQLIANWLRSQVQFNPPKKKPAKKPAPSVVDVSAISRVELEVRDREVKQLRSQVRLLTGGLIVAIALLGSTTLWLGYTLALEQNPQASEQVLDALVRDRP
jgi:hypothetical protein